jgi:hypothetical protein
MLQLKPLDPAVTIFQQIQTEQSPVILVNVFTVAEEDVPALLEAWEADGLTTGCSGRSAARPAAEPER